MVKTDSYPYKQYSAKLHTHVRTNGISDTHAHRTWPMFHGHDGLPVLPDVQVEVVDAHKPEEPMVAAFLAGRADK